MSMFGSLVDSAKGAAAAAQARVATAQEGNKLLDDGGPQGVTPESSWYGGSDHVEARPKV